MEEIREIAQAYYKNLSEEQRRNANQMFVAMDLDGDGKVTIDEYIKMFSEMGFTISNPRFIKGIDRNGDGILDYEEFLSLYYLLKSERLIFCHGNGCGAFLNGLYFTCFHCFSNNQNTSYDLCSSCFNKKNYHHHHDTILDNFTLLRSMAACSKAANVSQQAQTTVNSIVEQLEYSTTDDQEYSSTDRGRRRRSRLDGLRRLVGALPAGQVGKCVETAEDYSCTIM